MCVYQERKKPGLRIAHVHELEDKVNRLEAVLQSLGRRVEEHILEHDALHHRDSNQLYHGPGLIPRSEPRSSGVPSDTISQRSPIVDGHWQQANGYSRDQRPPELMSVRSVIDPPHAQYQHPRAYSSTAMVESPAMASDSELPPYDLVYSLVDLFFKHINPWSPILDRKSTFDTLFGGARLAEPDRVLMHAIVATTIRFSKDSRLTPESRQRYHDSSKTKILLHGVQYPSVQALQALVILAIDLLGTACDGSGMNLIALIARNITGLSLGIEKAVYLGKSNYHPVNTPHHFTQSQPQSWIEEEGRRRLVWIVYILDRYTSVSTCSSFVFNDDEMDRRLPCTYDLFSRNQPVSTRWPHITHRLDTSPSPQENLGSFSYHCEVLTILSRVHNFLRQPIDIHSHSSLTSWRNEYTTLDAELNAWLASLPGEYSQISQLCHSDPGSKISNWIMLHAAFVTAVIRLHSAAAYPTTHSHLFQPSFAAMQRCLGAVESLCEIAQDTINNSMLDLLGPPFAFSLWTSARLLLVHAATVGADAPPGITPGADYAKLDFFTSTLEAMGGHWRLAAVYAETLKRVVVEGQNATQPMPVSEAHLHPSSRPRTFKQMRKKACDFSEKLGRRQTSSSTSQSTQIPNTASNIGNTTATSAPASTPALTYDTTALLNPEANEMEYLDIFEFFNFPVVAAGNGEAPRSRNGERLSSPSFPMPMRENDWLGQGQESGQGLAQDRGFQPPRE